MLLFITMLAATPDPLAMRTGMDSIPVVEGTLATTDMLVPVSDSVRAATWDQLAQKPTEPVRFKVACIVFAAFGVPGSCVAASQLAAGTKTIDWAKVRDENVTWERNANPMDVALLRVITARLQTARAPMLLASKSLFVIMMFEDTVGPGDARASFVEGDALSMNDIRPARPIDGTLLGKLYPVTALRNEVTARVTMTCDIQPNLRLLCRDQGKIDLFATDATDTTGMIQDFRFATYQFASTLQLEPTSVNGDALGGKKLRFSILWKIPR